MRRIAVSVLSLFVVLPALADARLPVVNIAAGSVSARAAFGEEIVSKPEKNVSAVKSETVKVAPKKKTVVARSAKKKTAAPKVAEIKPTATSVDSGEQIIAHADVLAPRRPSSDLWARSDAPLRLPSPEEFAVIRSDAALPEESLDGASKPAVVARASAPVVEKVSVAPAVEPMSEIDAQIARLNELQRRADESVSDFAPTPIVEKTLVSTPAAPRVASSRTVVSRPTVKTAPAPVEDEVKLSRMVVPMEQDVIVRAVEKSESPRIASVRDDMTKMTPTELRKAFRKTFLSENKHLSTFQIDDRFDVASDMTASMEGFTAKRDLSESGGIRPLEIKIKFRDEDSALSRDNYNLLTEYAGIALSNPTRAIQISIPQRATRNTDDRKLAARRLAIVEQVLRDTGVSEHRILPVLSQRDEEGFVLRMISSDQYETLTQKQRDMFGDTVSKKSYKSMTW